MTLPKAKPIVLPVATVVRRFADALKNRVCPLPKEIEWVKNNIGREIERIPEDEPPSIFAVVLLARCERDDGLDFFLKEFVTKLIPSKSQLELEQRTKDDGRVLSMLLRAQEEFDANRRAEEPGGEPALPPDGDRPGIVEQNGAG